MPTNKDLIRMHLEEFLREDGGIPNWRDWSAVLAYCLGYYGGITAEHIIVVRALQREGLIQ